MATAIVMPVRSALARASAASTGRSSSRAGAATAASGEAPAGLGPVRGRIRRSMWPARRCPAAKPATSTSASADHVAEARVAVLEALDGGLDDPEAVLEDVHEDEGEHADGEHRQRHAPARGQELEPPDWQAQEDREAGEGSEQDGLSEGHSIGADNILGKPKFARREARSDQPSGEATAEGVGRLAPRTHETVSVPSMPAARWPSTGQ